MLLYFPEPQPDEMFFGACSRYFRIFNEYSQQATAIDLFGHKLTFVSRALPTYLKNFCNNLPIPGSLKPKEIIENHSMLPLYRPFLPEERAARLVKGMVYGNISGSGFGYGTSNFPVIRRLRCCVDCMVDDEKSYGASYWHRSHQINGVAVCHIHETILKSTPVPIYPESGGRAFVHLEPSLVGPPVIDCNSLEANFEYYFWIAKAAHKLLKIKCKKCNQELSRKIHLHFLNKAGLMTPSGSIRQSQLVQLLYEYYGDSFLEMLGLIKIEPKQNHTWLSRLVSYPGTLGHPLQHLLLMQMLGVEVDEFLCTKPSLNHFGEPPWPCLNPLASHYRENIVVEMKQKGDCSNDKILGIFKCECGFVYQREGPDKSRKDRYRYDQVNLYGRVFKQKIVDSVLIEGNSHNEVARGVKLSRETVSKIVKKAEQGIIPNKERVTPELLEAKKQEWLDIMQKNPTYGRTELQKYHYRLYQFLCGNAESWINENQPPSLIENGRGGRRNNWEDIGNDCLDEVDKVVCEIADKKPPCMITFSRVKIGLGLRGGSTKYIEEKMPKLFEKILSVTETALDFQKRRMKYHFDDLCQEGEEVNRFKVLSRSGLYSKGLNRKPEINQYLEELFASLDK